MMFLFAYFGPETTLPLASGIMTVVGFAFMMGRNSFSFLGRQIRGVAQRSSLAERQGVAGKPRRKIRG
jgi:hypothetical protein